MRCGRDKFKQILFDVIDLYRLMCVEELLVRRFSKLIVLVFPRADSKRPLSSSRLFPLSVHNVSGPGPGFLREKMKYVSIKLINISNETDMVKYNTIWGLDQTKTYDSIIYKFLQ